MAKVPVAKARSWRYALLLGAYGLYLLGGAAILAALEGPAELDLLDSLRQAQGHLLAGHRACLSEERLARLLERLLHAGQVGGPARWELPSALFFAASLLTTTGYGHTVPLSEWGKIFCLFYAAVGIPVTLLFLADLLRLLVPLLSHRPVRYLHARWGLPLGPVALGHAVALGLATLGLFILLPAIGFWAAEDRWSFLESVYFCFISLSTIGFGNHVPPQGNSGPPAHVLYELSITCYLLVGLLAMAATLETVHQLREVRAVIQFFAPARDPVAEDRQDILPRDQLALATVSRPDSQEEPVGGSAT